MKELTGNFGKNVFENFWDLFFEPEINRRKKEGLIDENFEFFAGQVIFFPSPKKPLIRINKEVSANVKVIEEKLEDKIIEKIQYVELNEKEFENCGHITLIHYPNGRHLSFDFIRNQALVRKHLKTSNEFIETAIFALKKDYSSSFIDNAFSSMELLAKCRLLTEPVPDLSKKSSHKLIKSEFNKRYRNNAQVEERLIFNKLSDLRNKARYLKGYFTLNIDECNAIITAIKNMSKDITNRV